MAQRNTFQHVIIAETSSTLASQIFKFVGYGVNRPELHGPFDVIGDVHGCIHELELLLKKLGYVSEGQGAPCTARHAEHRKLVHYFRGTLKKVGRGLKSNIAQYELPPQQVLSDGSVALSIFRQKIFNGISGVF